MTAQATVHMPSIKENPAVNTIGKCTTPRTVQETMQRGLMTWWNVAPVDMWLAQIRWWDVEIILLPMVRKGENHPHVYGQK